MSEIKRYEHTGSYGAQLQGSPHPKGEWVLHADHLAAVEAAVMAERAAILVYCEDRMKDISRAGMNTKSNDYLRILRAGLASMEHIADAIRARTTQPAEGSK